MASQFQRSKIVGVFEAMDANDDHRLGEDDFRALAARWSAIRGVAPGSADHDRLSAIMMGWWTALRGVADASTVTVDDVLALVDRLPEMPDAVTGTARAMFGAIDENGDGRISAAEYRQLIEAWNGRPTDTDEVFPLLDLNGDGYVTEDEFTRLWTQFWAGDDPDEPGTWVFGRFELPVSGAR